MSGERIAALEAELDARRDRETFAVYGDALQAIGDPRGDLIALDLYHEAHAVPDPEEHRVGLRPDPEEHRVGLRTTYEEVRARLVDAWLGPVASLLPPPRFGFFDEVRVTSSQPPLVYQLGEILRSPAAPYLRAIELNVNRHGLRAALELLALEVRPWLERLSFALFDPESQQVPLAEALGGVAPRLREVVVHGACCVTAPMPASVRRLWVTGANAVRDFAAGGVGIVELGLKPQFDWRTPVDVLARRLGPAGFPALSRLYLKMESVAFDPVDLLLALEAPERLREVWISPYLGPPLPGVERLRERLPGLALHVGNELGWADPTA